MDVHHTRVEIDGLIYKIHFRAAVDRGAGGLG